MGACLFHKEADQHCNIVTTRFELSLLCQIDVSEV